MLGTHREYISLLREEIRSVERESEGAELPLKKLRLMDSFLRETARLNPLDGRKFDFPLQARIPTAKSVPDQRVGEELKIAGTTGRYWETQPS